MTKNASATYPSWSIHHLKSPVDGTSIRYAVQPSSQATHGILFLNGRSEWIEKYASLPAKLNLGPQFTWATLDHRGQGASDGHRAHVNSYDEFAIDAAEVARQAFGARPYAIIAHSMGGLISIFGILKQYLQPQAAVLSSPLLGLNTPMPRTLARAIAHCLAATPLNILSTGTGSDRRNAFSNNPLTSSYEGFEAIRQAPYPHTPPSFGWVNATFNAIESIHSPELLSKLPCPIKIIVGMEERVVDAAAYAPWVGLASRYSQQAIEWKKLGAGRHELLNEIDRIERLALDEIRAHFKQHKVI